MASEILTPEESPRNVSSPSHARSPQHYPAKPQRVLACVLCQQRKIKCDRKSPCAGCTKAGAQCIPASLVPRQRRRRFPERELLDRLRHYEELLRQHQIGFEPLHPGRAIDGSAFATTRASSDKERMQEAASDLELNTDESMTFRTKNFWHAMNRKSQNPANDDQIEQTGHNEEDDDDDSDSDSSAYILREKAVKKAWDTLYNNTDALLFCSRNADVRLLALHPDQIQIFKLWQIYLENFNPLLKVTHTPTLQARIIDAASDIANISPSLEALMFSIYSVAIFSLNQTDCIKLFHSPREDLLARYQLGAKEALLNCGFLKTGDRDCLTALHFYLMTVKPATDPRSLSAMLGVAVRIAQRMGIHDETANSKHPPLEAELRRRLWWSIVLFDARISEMTEFRLGLLLPTWDCKQPSSVNDFDLRLDMKTPPEVHSLTSEALFAVIRTEFGNFIRHSSHHLDFINPALKSVARGTSTGLVEASNELDEFGRMVEENYLQKCDPQNPLHYMTTWWARGQLAKCRFIKQISQCSKATGQRMDRDRDARLSYALTMLECDSKLMTSQAIQGYRWLIYLNFPFPAYVHIVQDLRKRPLGEHARVAWDIMSENCSARFMDIEDRDNPMERKGNPFFKIFAGIVLQAWTAREAAMARSEYGTLELPPLIVTQIKGRLAHLDGKIPTAGDGSVVENDTNPSFSGGIEIAPSYSTDTHVIGTNHDSFMVTGMQPQMSFDANTWGWPTNAFHPMLGNGW